MYDSIPHILLFIATASFLEGLAVYAWRFRGIPGARPYAVHKASIAFFLFSLVMASLGAGLAGKVPWIKLYNTGTYTAVLAWLALALQMTGRGRWVNRRTVAGALIVLALTVLLLCTNARHLYWSRLWIEVGGVRAAGGSLNTVFLSIGYAILIFSTGLFVDRSLRTKGVLRTQAGILVFSTCITMAGHFCWRFGPSAGLRQDSLAITLLISGFLDAFALFRLRMFDLMPLAQSMATRAMGDGLVVVDAQGLIAGLNPAAERMLARSSAEAGGIFAAEAFKPWPGLLSLIRGSGAETGEISLDHRYYAVSVVPLSARGRGKMGKALLFHDITGEKAAREELLEQQRAVAVMEERGRLSREIHDGEGQLWGYLQMQLEAARSLLAGGHAAQAESLLGQLADFTHGLHVDIRESIASLKIAADEEGFLKTLRDYLRWFEQNYGIEAGLSVNGEFVEEALSPAAAVQLQRIVQEALTNVRKHAGARHVRVMVNTVEDEVEIAVEDDGAGFDQADVMAQKGTYGLGIMRERAAGIGAELDIDSGPGAGTRVRVRIPARMPLRRHTGK